MSVSSSSADDHDNDGAVDLAGLSFVERQEEWLRRKQTTLRAKTHEVERAVKNAATFNPNLAISQSSLRPAQVQPIMCHRSRTQSASLIAHKDIRVGLRTRSG